MAAVGVAVLRRLDTGARLRSPVSIDHPGDHHSQLATGATFAAMMSRTTDRAPVGIQTFRDRERKVATRATGERFNRRLAVGAVAHNGTIAGARGERDQLGPVKRPEQIRLDGLADALNTMVGRFAALKARNRELASEVKQLRAERHHLRTVLATLNNSPPVQPSRRPHPRASLAGEDERRRRLERDLHDGVQNELVSLIVKLSVAEQDRDTPPALAATLSALGARAEAALDSVREIARGMYPPPLAGLGVLAALRAQTARALIEVSLVGAAPRSTQEAEAAVYFSCLEAIQNVAKHAGGAAQATLTLHHENGALAVRIEDDGGGFDPAQTPDGAGLRNIHDRIQTLEGTVRLTSSPGRGTVLTISLPWPPRPPQTTPAGPMRSTEHGGVRLTLRPYGRQAHFKR
jgi:signal transduction histidine kinase